MSVQVVFIKLQNNRGNSEMTLTGFFVHWGSHILLLKSSMVYPFVCMMK